MIEKILIKNNLKVTNARVAIIDKIIEYEKPITAEEIYSLIIIEEKINLSTIYRNLNILAAKDIIKKVLEVNGQIYYQFNDFKHKHHLICVKCKTTVSLNHCPIKSLEEELSNTTGYKIISHSLEFRGICPKCLKNSSLIYNINN